MSTKNSRDELIDAIAKLPPDRQAEARAEYNRLIVEPLEKKLREEQKAAKDAFRALADKRRAALVALADSQAAYRRVSEEAQQASNALWGALPVEATPLRRDSDVLEDHDAMVAGVEAVIDELGEVELSRYAAQQWGAS